jgi:RNA polymerase sigma-70 factor (ECF subfamily)
MKDDSPARPEATVESRFGSATERRDVFVTTQWSVVLAAGTHDFERAAAALHRLCSTYWYPIYAFIRRRGADVHEAEDLTQSFFAYLLEGEILKKADQDRGRFRSFLLSALTNFLNNEWAKRQTLKRGGQRQIISLDEVTAEGLYHREPVENFPPEKLFDRGWAALLVKQVLVQLREEYASANNAGLLARLEPLLTQEIAPGLYAELATEFGMNEGAVKVALHRLRRRFGELVRREVSQTVADESLLNDEIRYLFSAISE